MSEVYNAARNERRKLMLQAALNARRKSLMNMISPTDLSMSSNIQDMTSQALEMEANIRNALSGMPQSVQSIPVQSAGEVISDPTRLPGQDIVDANNSAAINLARQNPGVNLTDELNRRAAAGVEAQVMGSTYQDQVVPPPPQVQSQAPMATDYGPGLTPAAAEELYGPGGMYGTQPLAGGLYDQMGISPAGMGVSPTVAGSTIPTKTASEDLVDEIKTIERKAGVIRGSIALFGGDPRIADRYEAKALANLSDYAGQYALSQLTDADFQNKARFIQAANKSLMPFDMMTDLLPHIGPDSKGKTKAQEVVRLIGPDGVEFTGKVDWSTGEARLLRMDGTPVASGTNLAPTKPPVEKKFINWTDGDKNIAIREGEPGPPGFWVGKAGEDPKGTSMRFIDPEGVGHLGYVRHDETGVPRYYLNNGSPVPEGWDMASPTASKITNNLSLQGEKMGEARQIAMAKMSRKWSNDAASYFFDEVGRFKADRLDIIKATLDVPGEGRLAWTQMKNALAAALRLESGAAIGVEEAANYKERFFPKMTDTEKTIIWKLRAFNDYVRALETINNPQWVYENLPHPAWNPKKVKTEKERDALPHGSYFITPSGNLGRYVPNQTEAEVLLQ